MNNQYQKQFNFGHDILGPIFYDFCRKLYLYEYSYKQNSISLFAFRGGVRLHYIYNRYLEKKNLEPPNPHIPFLISRISALKGTLYSDFKNAEKLILRMYSGFNAQQFISCFCTDLNIDIDENVSGKVIDGEFLQLAFFGKSNWAKKIQYYLKTQKELLTEYVHLCTKNFPNILFIDTGWSGTTQSFLMHGFPEKNWYGLYFGKWDTWGDNPDHFHLISGIGVEANCHKKKRLEEAIVEYHHIIEGPFEPSLPTIDHFVKDVSGNICAPQKIDYDKIPPQNNEPLYAGICEFIESSEEKKIFEISRLSYISRKRLHKKIRYPNNLDKNIMEISDRSIDFGQKDYVPILQHRPKGKITSLMSSLKRVEKSIWKQGQIVEEFPFFYPIILIIYNNRKFIKKIFSFIRDKYFF